MVVTLDSRIIYSLFVDKFQVHPEANKNCFYNFFLQLINFFLGVGDPQIAQDIKFLVI